MSERLNIELVRRLKAEKGVKTGWLVSYVGLGYTAGHMMFREGLLPKNPFRRKMVLKKLASFFGVDERQLILRLEAKTA